MCVCVCVCVVSSKNSFDTMVNKCNVRILNSMISSFYKFIVSEWHMFAPQYSNKKHCKTSNVQMNTPKKQRNPLK